MRLARCSRWLPPSRAVAITRDSPSPSASQMLSIRVTTYLLGHCDCLRVDGRVEPPHPTVDLGVGGVGLEFGRGLVAAQHRAWVSVRVVHALADVLCRLQLASRQYQRGAHGPSRLTSPAPGRPSSRSAPPPPLAWLCRPRDALDAGAITRSRSAMASGGITSELACNRRRPGGCSPAGRPVSAAMICLASWRNSALAATASRPSSSVVANRPTGQVMRALWQAR